MLHTSVRYHWHWMVNLCSAPWTVHVQQCPFLAETVEPILLATAEPDIEGNYELGRQIRTSCSPYMGNLLKPAGWGCPSESPVASALNTNTTAHSRWGFSFWLHCRRHQIPSTPHVEKDASATVLPKGGFLKTPSLDGFLPNWNLVWVSGPKTQTITLLQEKMEEWTPVGLSVENIVPIEKDCQNIGNGHQWASLMHNII